VNHTTGYAVPLLLAIAFVTAACGDKPASTSFAHDSAEEAVPWTDTDFDATADKFTFAVFSDLTGGEREGIFEIAIAQLSLLRPEFIINVGDLIEGGTADLTEIERQWKSFDDRAAKATARVFYVGGNHDLTGELLQSVWQSRYGRRYYHFIYRNTLFLVLDTDDHSGERMQEILEARDHALRVAETEGWDAFATTEYANMPENAAGNISAEQSQYFKEVIAANPGVRWTFLFMHKSPWLREELSTFTEIEDALDGRPYTLFNGHVHAYQHLKRRGRDYLRLATTGGVQLPANGRSMDHVTLVTVGAGEVDIANLLMEGILDKTGHIPLGGDDRCFELAACDRAP
jgi:hypothetical protein